MFALFHATNRDLIYSIQSQGLLVRKALCTPNAIWACTRRGMQAAVRHVCRRHCWRDHEIVFFPIESVSSIWTVHSGFMRFTLQDLPWVMLGEPRRIGGFRYAH